MLVEIENNKIAVKSEINPVFVVSKLTFEKVINPEVDKEQIAVVPMFNLYVYGFDGTDVAKQEFKEMYQHTLLTMSLLIPEAKFICTWDRETIIYSFEYSLVQVDGEIPTKIPVATKMELAENI